MQSSGQTLRNFRSFKSPCIGWSFGKQGVNSIFPGGQEGLMDRQQDPSLNCLFPLIKTSSKTKPKTHQRGGFPTGVIGRCSHYKQNYRTLWKVIKCFLTYCTVVIEVCWGKKSLSSYYLLTNSERSSLFTAIWA